MIYLVDAEGRITALTSRDYIALPIEAVEETHVFLSLGTAYMFAEEVNRKKGLRS